MVSKNSQVTNSDKDLRRSKSDSTRHSTNFREPGPGSAQIGNVIVQVLQFSSLIFGLTSMILLIVLKKKIGQLEVSSAESLPMVRIIGLLSLLLC